MRSWVVWAFGGVVLGAVGGQASWSMLFASGPSDHVVARPIVVTGSAAAAEQVGGPTAQIAAVGGAEPTERAAGMARGSGGNQAVPGPAARGGGQRAVPGRRGVMSTVAGEVTTLGPEWSGGAGAPDAAGAPTGAPLPADAAAPTGAAAPAGAPAVIAPTALPATPVTPTRTTPRERDDARRLGTAPSTGHDD
jgi:hypothetical protein